MGNWDNGQVSTLGKGQTLTCTTLAKKQLYGIILYNSQQNDQNADVAVNWSNSHQPVNVTVPGTTADQGSASVVLVSGNDTSTVAISIAQTSANPQVQCWLGSVSMPRDTSGLTNRPLPADGEPQPFGKYFRYFAVPAASWQTLTISSSITQFIAVQFQEYFATIYILNPTAKPHTRVTTIGSITKADYEIVKGRNPPQSISHNLQGDGTQWVWMNADSSGNSDSATISLQPLSGLIA